MRLICLIAGAIAVALVMVYPIAVRSADYNCSKMNVQSEATLTDSTSATVLVSGDPGARKCHFDVSSGLVSRPTQGYQIFLGTRSMVEARQLIDYQLRNRSHSMYPKYVQTILSSVLDFWLTGARLAHLDISENRIRSDYEDARSGLRNCLRRFFNFEEMPDSKISDSVVCSIKDDDPHVLKVGDDRHRALLDLFLRRSR